MPQEHHAQGPLVAGVDCSTQSTKVVIVDVATGARVATGSVPHELHREGSHSETDPEIWWQALQGALGQTGLADGIDAISIAAQQLGLLVVDRDRRPLRRAILWDDTRSAAESRKLEHSLGGAEAWLDQVGSLPRPGLTVSSWAWLREHEPDVVERTAAIRLPHDHLTERLTNAGVTDRGDASGTGWWSGRQEDYAQAVLDLPEVAIDRSLLPEVLPPDAPAGTVTRAAAEQLGLRPGIPVACGTGDNMAAALALGVGPGEPVVSLGTSGTIYARSSVPAADATGQVFAQASASGDHLPLACTLNATLAVDRIAALLGVDREAVADRTDVTVLPYLTGERLPDYPTARGTITGLGVDTTPGDVLLATYEGVAASLAAAIGALDANSSGLDPDAPITLVGGGARGVVWQHTMQRLTGRALRLPREQELVAWGAACQAGALLGTEGALGLAARWGVRDGPVLEPMARDEETIERIRSVREATDPLNRLGERW